MPAAMPPEQPVADNAETPPAKEGVRPGAVDLSVSVVSGRADGLPQLPSDDFKAILEMIDRHFKVLSEIAKNMGVSKEQRELAQRRLEELKAKRRQAEDLKQELDATLREIQDFLVDDEDKRRIEENQREVRA